jgi:hypothetical protein
MELTEEYEVIPYRSEFLGQVTKVLMDLWGRNIKNSNIYFKWKYDNNPYADRPLGIVALRNNKVVGFRGYFAEEWQVGNKRIKILVAGDTCVHGNHRRKGVSVAMGNKAIEEFGSEFDVFMNFAATPKATLGYKRLGFLPLADRHMLERMIQRTDVGDRVFPTKEWVQSTKFDEIIVTLEPKAQEMYDLVSKEPGDVRLSLVQDKKFFEWRFKNNTRNTYLFCYYVKEGVIQDYIVFGTPDNYGKGIILDYTEHNVKGFKKMIEFAISRKFYDKIKIGGYGLTENVDRCLKDLGFNYPTHTRRAVVPLFVRASAKDPTESDWFIEGLDIRNIKNWKIRGICSEWE